MKRYFAVIIMAFAFTLTACGSSTGADQDSKAASDPTFAEFLNKLNN